MDSFYHELIVNPSEPWGCSSSCMSLPAAGFRNRFRSPVQRLGGAFRPRPESPGIVYNAARRPGLAPASQDPFRRGPRVRPGHKKDFLVAQRKLLATPSHLLDSLYRGRAGQRMNYISKHFRLPETGSVEAHPELHRAGLGLGFPPLDPDLGTQQADLSLLFLGTSSGGSSRGRSSQAICLRTQHNGIWLFDCGERTCIQLFTSHLRIGALTRIFITHMHADHVLGITTVLLNAFQGQQSIHIYGPVGIRDFVSQTLRGVGQGYLLSALHFVELLPTSKCPYRHRAEYPEFWKSWDDGRRTVGWAEPAEDDPGMEMDSSGESEESEAETETQRSQPKTQESIGQMKEKGLEFGSRHRIVKHRHPTEIFGPESELKTPVWLCHEDDECWVVAAPLRHKIPCFGYVMIEKDTPPQLLKEKITARTDIPAHMRKFLKTQPQLVLDNGEVIDSSEFWGPTRPGRKIVILGDTSDSRLIHEAARNADVVTHEATMFGRDSFLRARKQGHSLAAWAGQMAVDISARLLLLTHISPRYTRPVSDLSPRTDLEDLVLEALHTTQRSKSECSVILAEDFMEIGVARRPLRSGVEVSSV